MKVIEGKRLKIWINRIQNKKKDRKLELKRTRKKGN